MTKRAGLTLAFAATFFGPAAAQTPSGANLLTDFKCPAGKCETKCGGPSGSLIILAADVKVFQFASHPRRLWLLADGAVHVLGDDDRCQFGGATQIQFISPPVQVSPLGPSPKPNTPCIGPACPK
jgi:hypothetical protein